MSRVSINAKKPEIKAGAERKFVRDEIMGKLPAILKKDKIYIDESKIGVTVEGVAKALWEQMFNIERDYVVSRVCVERSDLKLSDFIVDNICNYREENVLVFAAGGPRFSRKFMRENITAFGRILNKIPQAEQIEIKRAIAGIMVNYLQEFDEAYKMVEGKYPRNTRGYRENIAAEIRNINSRLLKKYLPGLKTVLRRAGLKPVRFTIAGRAAVRSRGGEKTGAYRAGKYRQARRDLFNVRRNGAGKTAAKTSAPRAKAPAAVDAPRINARGVDAPKTIKPARARGI